MREFLATVLLVHLFGAGVAFAQVRTRPPPSTATSTPLGFSTYEWKVAARVLEQRGLSLDAHPEGKRVESVEVEPLDVFEEDTFALGWLNWFHTTSRRDVVRREILLVPGQLYDRERIEESARKLREARQLSTVLVLPVQGTDPNQVRLLVVTQDVWSLRLNSLYRIKNGKLEYLFLQPSEENLAGTHFQISGQYTYELSTDTLGAGIAQRRLFGSHLALIAESSAILYRATGEIEGSTGRLYYGLPLYESRSRWGWNTHLVWDCRVNRPQVLNPDGSYRGRLYDDPRTPAVEALPYRYRSRLLGWTTSVTRSYGNQRKNDFSVGMEASERRFTGWKMEGYAPQLVRSFERDSLEQSDLRLGPYLLWHTYQNSYVTLYDVDTLGLAEDFRLGYQAFTKAYFGSRRAQSTRDLVGISTGLAYTGSWKRSLARAWSVHTSEMARQAWGNDGLFQLGLHLVSPPLGVGRLVYDAGGAIRYRNYRNTRWALGGDTRLRGYPSEQFIGSNLLVQNLEFRTRSVSILGVLLGLVGFYDAGDAYDNASEFSPKHSIGIGGRATIPQLQRMAGRLDVSFPLDPPRSRLGEAWPAVDVLLTLTGQAIPYPDPVPTTLSSPLLTYLP